MTTWNQLFRWRVKPTASSLIVIRNYPQRRLRVYPSAAATPANSRRELGEFSAGSDSIDLPRSSL